MRVAEVNEIFFFNFIVLIIISVTTKLLIIDQENKIKILNKKL